MTQPAEGPARSASAALRLRNISKTFQGTRALHEVSLDVVTGRVLALVGSNGSGKSTLIKILAGVEKADDGAVIEVAGQPHEPGDWTPKQSYGAGLRFVHQQLGLFDELTVAENLALGATFPGAIGGHIRWSRVREHAERELARVHADFSPDVTVGSLPPASRALVAIARALQDQQDHNDAVLILDEPTEALPRKDADSLLDSLRRFANGGKTVIYVSHRLDDVVRIADDIAVLRDGELQASQPARGITTSDLTTLIVGTGLPKRRDESTAGARPVDPKSARGQHGASTVPLLAVDGLAGGAVREATFTVQAGQVLGIAGLLGSGADELLELIFGARTATAGVVRLDGRPVRWRHPADAIAAGVAYVPANRQRDAGFGDMTLRDNLTIASLTAHWRRGRLSVRAERLAARREIGQQQIRSSSDVAPFWSLSGGNQQKAVLARWLLTKPRLLLLNEPTQGVDVGARAEIYRLVQAAASAGTAVIVVTADFDEMAAECDSIALISHGHLVASLDPPFDAHKLTAATYEYAGEVR